MEMCPRSCTDGAMRRAHSCPGDALLRPASIDKSVDAARRGARPEGLPHSVRSRTVLWFTAPSGYSIVKPPEGEASPTRRENPRLLRSPTQRVPRATRNDGLPYGDFRGYCRKNGLISLSQLVFSGERSNPLRETLRL
jgi:hypothetical protein